MDIIANAAMQYTDSLEWPLVLLHPRDKRPRLEAWQHNAACDSETVARWFTQWPDSNIGLLLGPKSGIADIEADDAEGQATAGELLADIFTPTWDSARGTHRLFQFPQGLPTDKAVTKARGLEIRLGTDGKGAQSVLPPSIHPSGKQLQWREGLSPFDVTPQPLPDSVLQLLAEGNGSTSDGLIFEFENTDIATATGATEGNRHDKLMRLVGAYLAERGADANLMPMCLTWGQRCTPPMPPERVIKEVGNLITADAKKRGQQPQQLLAPIPQPTFVVPRAKPELLKYSPFPTNLLPSPLDNFTKAAAKSVGCDESFIALPVLATCAALIGNARCFVVDEDWQEPCLLWLAVVGYPSDKKSPARQLATQPLVTMQEAMLAEHAERMQEYEAAKLVHEVVLKNWKRKGEGAPPLMMEAPPQPRLWADDTTIEALGKLLKDNPRGLLLRKDELSGWLKSFAEYKRASGDLQRWLQIFSAGAVTVDRVSTGPIYLPRPNVSVYGGIQPEILKLFFKGETVDAGLMQRFAFAWPPLKVKGYSRYRIGQSLKAEYATLLSALHQLPFEDKPEAMPLAPDALDLFQQWSDAVAEERWATDVILRGAVGKLEATAVRLAGVLHCVRQVTGQASPEPVIDYQSMQLGVAMARWFLDEWYRVADQLREAGDQAADRQLVEYILAKHGGRITPFQLSRHKRGVRNSEEAEAILHRLSAAGWGVMQPVQPTARGGRPTVEFAVITPVAVAETS